MSNRDQSAESATMEAGRDGTPCHHHHHEEENCPFVHAHDGHHHDHRVSSGHSVLTVRAVSGLSGDMMLTGLMRMNGIEPEDPVSHGLIDELLSSVGLPALLGSVSLEHRSINHIAGWGCKVKLPHEHEHRTLKDITEIIEASSMVPAARDLAIHTFSILAEAEGRVHGKPASDVHFHEVGALDSILDICMSCMLFVRLNPGRFVCSPLPMGEGGVRCAHGWIPTPAPAVLELLQDIPVCGFAGHGETVTPTAVALLRTLGAEFGPWPTMRIQRRSLVYGDRVFTNAPNGSIWALGTQA